MAINKIDLPDVRKKLATIARPFKRRGIELHAISAATGEGVGALLEADLAGPAPPSASWRR